MELPAESPEDDGEELDAAAADFLDPFVSDQPV